VVGRITEAHLSEAEKTFPGIGKMYRRMADKPVTFLQLVWRYEAIAAACVPARPPRRTRRVAGT
jgi:hypothetical protein